MIMFKIFRGKAFVSNHQISGRDVIGNPASVVLFDAQFPAHEELSRIAKEEQAPMTAFIRPLAEQEYEYEIIFYTPAGESFGLCGHATLIAAYFLQKEFSKNNVVFVRSFEGVEHRIQSELNDDGVVRIVMPAFEPTSVSGSDYNKILGATGMNGNGRYDFYKCDEMHDMIIMADSASAVRKAMPQFDVLASELAKNNIRGLFITSRSAEDEADYEVRIFAPHLGISEDISCGSANCSLLPLWNKQLNAEAGKKYSILCPYNDNGKRYGGIELGSYHAGDKQIEIGGFVTEI